MLLYNLRATSKNTRLGGGGTVCIGNESLLVHLQISNSALLVQFQDQDRRFASDTCWFSNKILVCDHISDYQYTFSCKARYEGMQIQFGYTKFMSHAFYVPSRAPVIRNEVLLACVSSAMARGKADRAIPDLYVALFVARDVDFPRGNRMLLPLPLLLQRVDERDCGISKDLALEHHTQYKVYPY